MQDFSVSQWEHTDRWSSGHDRREMPSNKIRDSSLIPITSQVSMTRGGVPQASVAGKFKLILNALNEVENQSNKSYLPYATVYFNMIESQESVHEPSMTFCLEC